MCNAIIKKLEVKRVVKQNKNNFHIAMANITSCKNRIYILEEIYQRILKQNWLVVVTVSSFNERNIGNQNLLDTDA